MRRGNSLKPSVSSVPQPSSTFAPPKTRDDLEIQKMVTAADFRAFARSISDGVDMAFEKCDLQIKRIARDEMRMNRECKFIIYEVPGTIYGVPAYKIPDLKLKIYQEYQKRGISVMEIDDDISSDDAGDLSSGASLSSTFGASAPRPQGKNPYENSLIINWDENIDANGKRRQTLKSLFGMNSEMTI